MGSPPSSPASMAIAVPSTVRGLIFDCDGTLVDSMPLHMQAWEHAIGQFGVRWDRELIHANRGMKEVDIVTLYNQHLGTDLDPEKVVAEKHRYFSESLPTLKPFAPVLAVVHRYRSVLPMAVVSGSVRDIVMRELDVIGLAGTFATVLTADDPLPPKPAPDLFREAARRMGVLPVLCQVFEDGDLGLEAARRAGMLATDVRPFTGQ